MPFNWMELEASLLADILSERTCNILAKAQESGLQWKKRKKESEFKTIKSMQFFLLSFQSTLLGRSFLN